MVGKKNEFRQDTLAMMLETAFLCSRWVDLEGWHYGWVEENFGPVSAVVESHG